MRVVLYAEGSTEDRGITVAPMQGELLPADAHGPAHVLVARSIAEVSGRPRSTIQFVTPLRLRGRIPRGSDLHVSKHIWQLLTFPEPTLSPDLGIILIDEDGQSSRYRDLAEALVDREFLLPYVIAIPVREFEAWLLADQGSVSSLLGVATTPPSLESMKPGTAKELLQRTLARHLDGTEQTQRAIRVGRLRRALAEHANLQQLGKLRAFERFREDLRTAVRSIR